MRRKAEEKLREETEGKLEREKARIAVEEKAARERLDEKLRLIF